MIKKEKGAESGKSPQKNQSQNSAKDSNSQKSTQKEEKNKLVKKYKKKEKVVDEERQTVVYKRYYHVFWKGELEKLIEQIDGLEVVESYFDHANWVVKVKKL